MNNKIIIIGSAGHAKNVIDTIEKVNTHEIIGLVDDYRRFHDKTLGYEIIGKVSDIKILVEKYNVGYLFIAIGDNYNRSEVFHSIKDLGLKISFINVIHPTAILSQPIESNKGIFIGPRVVINRDAIVSPNTLFNSGAILEHDTKLGVFSSLGPNSTIAGGAIIGERTAVGLSASVLEKRVIGNDVVVGSGAVVISNIESNNIIVGLPARVLRSRKPNEKYLK